MLAIRHFGDLRCKQNAEVLVFDTFFVSIRSDECDGRMHVNCFFVEIMCNIALWDWLIFTGLMMILFFL